MEEGRRKDAVRRVSDDGRRAKEAGGMMTEAGGRDKAEERNDEQPKPQQNDINDPSQHWSAGFKVKVGGKAQQQAEHGNEGNGGKSFLVYGHFKVLRVQS